ncbi:MAG: hypothetical protein GX579_00535 [Chloroflexi bacterium]|nr:hypothetical protein [Chloroflexota bacterium]
MSSYRAVRVRVRPGEELRFPAACVHCGQPARPALPLRRRLGRVTREVDVPLCDDCQQEVRRLSGDEERRRKLGWLAAGLAFLIVFLVLFFLLPSGFPVALRLLLPLGLAALTAGALYTVFRRSSLQYARPEKQAILAAAQLAGFSWRTMTLAFADEAYARQFADLNESQLIVDEPNEVYREVIA